MNTTIEKDWIWIGVNTLEVFFVCIVLIKIELVCIFHVYIHFFLCYLNTKLYFIEISLISYDIFCTSCLQGAFPLTQSSPRVATKVKISWSITRAPPLYKPYRRWWTDWSKSTETYPEGENPRGHSNQLIKESNCSMNKTVHSMILVSSGWMAGWYFKQRCIAVSTFWELAQRSWSCQHPRIQ